MFNSDFKNFLKNILNLNLENDFIFIKDSDLNYIYANSKFCELFNIEVEDLIGKNDHFLIKNKELLKTCQKSDREALKNNHVISIEKASGVIFNVLKLKVSIGNDCFGILGFAKLEDDKVFKIIL